VRKINSQIHNINMFSNLSIKLNSYYTRIGFIRDEEDFLRVKEYFNSNLNTLIIELVFSANEF